MLHLPLLRWGRPYRSLTTVRLADVRSGAPVVEVSQANAGLIARDLPLAARARRLLASIDAGRMVELCRAAGQRFLEDELPCGDRGQSPELYAAQLCSTTGMPLTLVRRNMKKIHHVLTEMATVLRGLTRGLDLGVLDHPTEMARRGLAYRCETEALGLVLPSNSPGVHTLWLPAIPLKVPLALKPGRQEPWTPLRIAQAFIAAGVPAQAFGYYPSDHGGATELLLRCGRSVLFGDRASVAPWAGSASVSIHGPGWSKVVLGHDRAERWSELLDLLVESVADNGGRSCLNASGIWTSAHGDAIADALARRLAAIPARPLDHPQAALAAFPDRAGAARISEHIDRQLEGAQDVTARYRSGGRVADLDGCRFLLPTVIRCGPDHPLAQAEYLFPFVAVVEVPQAELVRRLGRSLVVSALTEDPLLIDELMAAQHVDHLHLGPLPTSRVSWDQPHEGNLFEHLYRRRALQTARFQVA
jgi:acyl-CoA reductase-like NAD-dependent aldehyde dehydrogenase